VIVRARSTRAQADLDQGERGANVIGAFRLSSAVGPPHELPVPDRRGGITVAGRRCLLVDDVATTGHTLLEALKALKASGPEGTGAAVFALA
jgi:predicted amidophosphoribosyltransferase